MYLYVYVFNSAIRGRPVCCDRPFIACPFNAHLFCRTYTSVTQKKYNITIRLRIVKWRFENEMKMFHEALRQVRGVTPCLDVARAQSARTVDTDCVFACG